MLPRLLVAVIFLALTLGGRGEDADIETDFPPSLFEEGGDISDLGPGALSTDPDDVGFYLYYDKNDPEKADRLFLNDPSSIKAGHFVPRRPVMFLTHGFMSSYNAPDSLVPYVKNAYLKANFPNVIAVNWEKLANPKTLIVAYKAVVDNGVPITGNQICKMIALLTQQGIVRGPEDVHLIGHSLGAHVSGIAGSCVKETLNKRVGRITGLDPAGPGFYNVPTTDFKLDKGDAKFVDVLHTSTELLGNKEQLGTVDFYSNGGGGSQQPGCKNATAFIIGELAAKDIAGICGHSAAYKLFARSILHVKPELYGCRCSSMQLLKPICHKPLWGCDGKTMFGQYVKNSSSGKFYLEVPDDLVFEP